MNKTNTIAMFGQQRVLDKSSKWSERYVNGDVDEASKWWS